LGIGAEVKENRNDGATRRSKKGNPQNGGPKLTKRRYHYKWSRYVTLGLLRLGLGLGLG